MRLRLQDGTWKVHCSSKTEQDFLKIELSRGSLVYSVVIEEDPLRRVCIARFAKHGEKNELLAHLPQDEDFRSFRYELTEEGLILLGSCGNALWQPVNDGDVPEWFREQAERRYRKLI